MLLLWMFRTGACHLGECITIQFVKTLLIGATLTQIPKGSSGSDGTTRLLPFDPAVKTNAEALQMPHSRPETKKRKNKKSTAPSADHDNSGDDRVTKKSKAATNTASSKFTVVLVGDTPAVDAGKATIPTVSQVQNKFGTNEAQFITISQDDSAEDIKKAVIGAFTASGCPFAGDPAIIQNFTFLFRKSNGRGHQNTLACSTIRYSQTVSICPLPDSFYVMTTCSFARKKNLEILDDLMEEEVEPTLDTDYSFWFGESD
ncbi:hypothetical protein K435DRAFT_808855 [Dendrothele bispora CBS 962.96]|uniref:Uncharacterized protein n=1 Tax=Dendrothele bispora (strain CBS 962.96) TaxID=1314807 RepID=A0A4S8L020_DENBC|nr:hypothetical protein K435DRAFT_808855 [Dendrothele bispora CBS 962.96]